MDTLSDVGWLKLKQTERVCAGISDLGTARLSRLVTLQALNLDMRSIGDGGVRNLSGLTNLRQLDLFGAKVSDTGCSWLRCLPLNMA